LFDFLGQYFQCNFS